VSSSEFPSGRVSFRLVENDCRGRWKVLSVLFSYTKNQLWLLLSLCLVRGQNFSDGGFEEKFEFNSRHILNLKWKFPGVENRHGVEQHGMELSGNCLISLCYEKCRLTNLKLIDFGVINKVSSWLAPGRVFLLLVRWSVHAKSYPVALWREGVEMTGIKSLGSPVNGRTLP